MLENPLFVFALDTLCFAALLNDVGGVVAWITTAVQFVAWGGTGGVRDQLWTLRLRVFRACVLFGAAFGAASGIVYGPALWLPSDDGPLRAIKNGALFGAALGAFGGGVAGFVGTMIAWRVRWIMAGVLGSAGAAGSV